MKGSDQKFMTSFLPSQCWSERDSRKESGMYSAAHKIRLTLSTQKWHCSVVVETSNSLLRYEKFRDGVVCGWLRNVAMNIRKSFRTSSSSCARSEMNFSLSDNIFHIFTIGKFFLFQYFPYKHRTRKELKGRAEKQK